MSSNLQFHDIRRIDRTRPVNNRRNDFLPILHVLTPDELYDQSARCTDCGVPFCSTGDTGSLNDHPANSLMVGCPGKKPIPDFVPQYHRYLSLLPENPEAADKALLQALHALERNFRLAGVTGRVCPAPCEHSCTHAQPGHTGGVMIRSIEMAIVDECIQKGIYPIRPSTSPRIGSVAVIGSGPAGYVAADTLNRIGFKVVVYEAKDRLGGLMRYGIPRQHGLDRDIVDFYFDVLRQEGVDFRLNSRVAQNINVTELLRIYEGVVVATGLPKPKRLEVPGGDLQGVYSPIDTLTAQDRIHEGDAKTSPFDAKGKTVLIIGRGFTYVDLLGLVGRQGAKRVILSYYRPDLPRDRVQAWPKQPGHWEAEMFYGEVEFHDILDQRFNTVVTEITGNDGKVSGAKIHRVTEVDGKPVFKNGKPVLAGEPTWHPCDIVIPAIGFGADDGGLSELLSSPKTVLAGDRRTGPSYVITACQSGYLAALELAKKIRPQ